MDCGRFQEQITDYLDGALEARARAECAAHRLRCRECREIYNDVRATVAALSSLDQMPAPTSLEERILSATTAGVMLNCFEFDRLLERYFDGVILAPTFQTFQAHFEHCPKCSRLLGSIEDAIALCREVKETEVEVPESLCDRIVAATSGRPAPLSWRGRLSRRGEWLGQKLRLFWTPQWAAAALIFIASCTFVGLRFGGMSGLASQAGAQADRIMTEGHVAINETGVMAITGLQRVSNGVTSLWREARRAKTPSRGRTQNPGTQKSSPSSSRDVKPIPASGQRGPGEGVQNP